MIDDELQADGISRRSVLLGLGAAAGAAAAVGALPGRASAAPHVAATPLAALAPTVGGDVPQAFGAPIAGLTYIGIDAQEFWTEDPSKRVYQPNTGTQSIDDPPRIWAGLRLPAGATVYQLNVGHYGQPIAEISRRLLAQPNPALPPAQIFQQTLPQPTPSGPYQSTLNLSEPIVIERESTYQVSFYTVGDDSVFGVSVGYVPPTQSFVPFAGATPRILDTREPGPLTGPLLPDQERVVDLGFAGARSALINLTVTGTGGPGYVAVFANGITWPGNSSINFTGANQTVANGVITATDSGGKIKIRGGASATHVIIDRIGFMI